MQESQIKSYWPLSDRNSRLSMHFKASPEVLIETKLIILSASVAYGRPTDGTGNNWYTWNTK